MYVVLSESVAISAGARAAHINHHPPAHPTSRHRSQFAISPQPPLRAPHTPPPTAPARPINPHPTKPRSHEPRIEVSGLLLSSPLVASPLVSSRRLSSPSSDPLRPRSTKAATKVARRAAHPRAGVWHQPHTLSFPVSLSFHTRAAPRSPRTTTTTRPRIHPHNTRSEFAICHVPICHFSPPGP